MRVTGVRTTVFSSAIVIDVIVHCHTAVALFESKCRKQLSLSSCGWVLIRSGQFKITEGVCMPSSTPALKMLGPPNGSLRDTSGVHTAWTTGLIPSLQAAVHRRVREENGVHTAHTRGATARPALAGSAEDVNADKSQNPPLLAPLAAKVAHAGSRRQGGSGGVDEERRSTNEAPSALNSLAGFEGQPGEPANQVREEVRARCLVLAWPRRLGTNAPSSEAPPSALLRRMSVHGEDGPSNPLVPFNADLVLVPKDLDDAPELLEVLPQVSRLLLEGDRERMQLEHGCEVEVP